MRIAILGAGISGLSLGWFLKQRFGSSITLSIYEKNPIPGGWIKSGCREGFLFEEGPRSCRSHGAGAATLSLIESLGLASDVITASPKAKKRYLYYQGRLHPLPGFFGMVCSPLTRDVIPALLKEWRRPSVFSEDESIYAFVARRFDSEVAERFADPMVTGIYAGDIRNLSMRSCFPLLFQSEQEWGSVLYGMVRSKKKPKGILSPFVEKIQKESSIFSLKHGMESLVTTLASRFKEELKLGVAVDAVEMNDGCIHLQDDRKGTQSFDRVFCALPASETLRLLGKNREVSSSFPRASVAVVNMGWRNQAVLEKKGFGYLVASREKQDVLGVVFDSSVFPQQNQSAHETRLTVMLGGTHRPEIASFSHEKIANLAKGALHKHLNINCDPDVCHVSVAKEAIPQYLVGHATQVIELQKEIAKTSANFVLLGSSWHGVAVNDCIAEAGRVALTL